MQATLLRLVGLGLVLTVLLAPLTAAASVPPTWVQSPAPGRDNDGDRPAAPAGPDRPPAEIESAMLNTLAVDNAADFVVVMAEQADLSAAYRINDRSARGWYVYDTLREVATRSQSPVVAYAKEHGLAYHSFLTTNSVYIEGGNLMAVQDLTTLPGVALIRLPKVAYIHPFREAGPASPNAYGWNLDTLHPANHQYGMQATQVWDQHGVRGAGIVVANIDTGAYYQHETLDRQYRGNTTGSTGGPYDHNYNWYQPNLLPCGDGTYPCDADGHGSGTIGIVVGENPDQSEQIGVAPGARWIACQGCDNPPYCTELALTGCADWMVAPALSGKTPAAQGAIRTSGPTSSTTRGEVLAAAPGTRVTCKHGWPRASFPPSQPVTHPGAVPSVRPATSQRRLAPPLTVLLAPTSTPAGRVASSPTPVAPPTPMKWILT